MGVEHALMTIAQNLDARTKAPSRSAVDELRCAFVEERVHAFFLIGGAKQAVEYGLIDKVMN